VIRSLEGNLNGSTAREPDISDFFEIFPAEIAFDHSTGYAHNLKRVSRCLNAFAPPTIRPTRWHWKGAFCSPRTLGLRPIGHMAFEAYGRFSLSFRLSWTRNILNTFGLLGAVYISRKRAGRVHSFKRSSKMPKARNNEYAKTGLYHRDKSKNKPDLPFYNVGREVSIPNRVQNLVFFELQTTRMTLIVRCQSICPALFGKIAKTRLIFQAEVRATDWSLSFDVNLCIEFPDVSSLDRSSQLLPTILYSATEIRS
jgi:hypothetical protein